MSGPAEGWQAPSFMKTMEEAVIVAGGKGTRLTSLTKDVMPKALIKIGDKPLIEHQILLLRKYGIKEIWLLLGHLGDQIKKYLRDGKRWNVNIHYHQEGRPLGTAGALKTIENEIKKDFLFLSGDIMLDFNIKRFITWHNQKKEKIASIIVHPNDHPFDSDLVEIDSKGKITSLLIRPHCQGMLFRNLSIASVFVFSPDIFRYIPSKKKCDFEKDVLPLILEAKEKVYAYNTPEYLRDVGTPERLMEINQDYSSGKIKRLNLKNKRKAVFLDRDGVINKEVDQLSKIGDFKIYDFVAKAIKKINHSDYLTIIISNQPMIAKGFMSEQDLNEIHKKLETELGFKGAKIDAFYYCPHHPEKGFVGERPKLKIKCDCRKPKIGLIKKAVSDFNLDLNKSFFIGDSSVDVKTAENAKIKFVGVKTGYACQDNRYQINKKFPIHKNLLQAVKNI